MTLRELVWMVDARQSSEWDRFAPLLAILFNANRGADSQPISVDKIHPYRADSKPNAVPLNELKRFF